MSDQDQGPSLELPPLGFRRRKKAQPEAAEPESAPQEAVEPDTEPSEPAEATEIIVPADAGTPVETAVDEPTQVIEAEPGPAEEEPAPGVPVAETVAEPAPGRRAKAAKEPKQPKQPKRAKEARPARARWLGAALVGLVSGFALVGLVGVTLQACDAARGTTSCGGPGLFVLFIILALITVGATRLLRWWGFGDAGTVSFLGIALTAIVVLVFLTADLQSLSMVLVVPVLTGLSFVLSDWVSATMSDADRS